MSETREEFWIDREGRVHDERAARGMSYPVRCTHCGGIYDVGKVEVIARHADCSVWKSPCCNLTVDDRGRGWKPRPDIEPIAHARTALGYVT